MTTTLDRSSRTVNGRRDVLTVILPGEDPRKAVLLGLLAFRAGLSVSGERLGELAEKRSMRPADVVKLLRVRWSSAKALLTSTKISQEILRDRFRHRSGLLRIPRKLIGMPGLSCFDLAVAGRIEATRSRIFVPSARHLSEDIGAPRRNVERSIAKLRRMGLIHQERVARPGCRNVIRRTLIVPNGGVRSSRAAESSRTTKAESISTGTFQVPGEGWTKKLAKAQAAATFMTSSPEDQRIFKALGLLGIYERSARARGEMAQSLANVHNYLAEEILDYAAVVASDPRTRNAPARFVENLRHPARMKLLVKRREPQCDMAGMLSMLAERSRVPIQSARAGVGWRS